MDQIWLVMELCDGGSVAELVQGLKKACIVGYLKEIEIAYILSEVHHALAYLHGHHRIHRDVKGGFQLEFVSISQVINHMTCYKSSAICALVEITAFTCSGE